MRKKFVLKRFAVFSLECYTPSKKKTRKEKCQCKIAGSFSQFCFHSLSLHRKLHWTIELNRCGVWATWGWNENANEQYFSLIFQRALHMRRRRSAFTLEDMEWLRNAKCRHKREENIRSTDELKLKVVSENLLKVFFDSFSLFYFSNILHKLLSCTFHSPTSNIHNHLFFCSFIIRKLWRELKGNKEESERFLFNFLHSNSRAGCRFSYGMNVIKIDSFSLSILWKFSDLNIHSPCNQIHYHRRLSCCKKKSEKKAFCASLTSNFILNCLNV